MLKEGAMKERAMRTTIAATTALACAALLSAAQVPVAAQAQGATARTAAPKAAAKPGPLPKTSWGDPDLQGTWDSTFMIDGDWGSTFERAAKYQGRAELTDQEVADLERHHAEADKAEANGTAALPRGGGGTAPNARTGAAWLGGGYNSWWLDQGVVPSNRKTSQLVDPPDGRLPKRTSAGEQSAQARRRPRLPESWEDLTFWERCLTKGGMPNLMLPRGYNNNTQIVQTPGYVALLHEMIHEVRIIPLDSRPHLPENVRQWVGDPRGHWEGDTLVVETTNIDSRVSGLQPWANFTSKGASQHMMKTIERFRRVEPNLVSYQMTVEDPEMYTKPWTVEIPMVKNTEPVFEYACHEGNYTMSDALGGARLQEKEEAERQAAEAGSERADPAGRAA